MGKVILKSVQDKRCLEKIILGEYKPDFHRSYGSFDDQCESSYNYMLGKLSEKTGKEYVKGKDTCIWSWYQNPFFRNHVTYKNIGVDLVVITFEIDEDDIVLSDFDIWCDMIVEGKGVNPIINKEDIVEQSCIQAVSWGIPKDSIIKVEPFVKYLKEVI